YHFDLYRLNKREDFFAMGFEEYLGGSGVALIEWAERLEGELLMKTHSYYFLHREEGGRVCQYTRYEEKWGR
ncbi:MAG: tRNA (adenosine(37)-N6)-threonylcarbamoyltransferase complex ATPase subunit type 1 TsaE, partial [Chlamydiia bacterium]|nr:tRNA (adenosine(37)-N6)-threonylcarbamoyltransferase complex ATPase subunit type 1 TsaE [Chlamydiia bacterium]